MSADRAQRLMDLYLDASDLAPEKRAAFLQTHCGADDALRERVGALLRCETDAAGFLAEPVFHIGAALLADAADGELAPGDRLGDCVIASLLGIGGMGEVYLARDTALGRPVAVKLIRRGGEPLRYFHHERQVLAALNHPHIARLYGGAVTPEGRAYLVMEYVEGKRLDAYCREHGLTVRARLEIFRKVCAAVSHAHQHLVVHRDLKPANILVTPEGEPKLLDFGIARLLDPVGEGDGDRTPAQPGAMTPAYASPEQRRGDPGTTATDVYSLGVVFHELLCGELPRAPKNRPLTGDLDSIVRRATDPDPARRYPSVSQFADDLRRHLESRPVSARRPTPGYVAARFVARNRAAAAAALLALLALCGGVAATVWQARRANVQRLKAERRFEDVRRLADSLMGEIHDSVQDLAGSTPTRKLIVSRALEYLDNLTRDADTPALNLDLAAAYRKVGDVQGNPYGANLGDADGARASYRKAESLLISKAGDTAAARLESCRVERALGDMAELRGDFAEMTRFYRRSLEVCARLAREQPADPAVLDELARAYETLGDGLDRTGGHGQAERADSYRQAISGREKLAAQSPGNVGYRRGIAIALMKLGRLTLPDQAHGVADIARAVAIMKTLSETHPDSVGLRRVYAMTLFNLGTAQAETGDHAGSLDSRARALPMREQLAAADPKDDQARFDLAVAHADLAEALTDTGQPGSALGHAQRAVAGLRALADADPGNAVYLRNCALAGRKVGAAHAALAAMETSGAPDRRAHWSDARAAYAQARDQFAALKSRGIVRPEDANALDQLAVNLAGCDQEMARLPER